MDNSALKDIPYQVINDKALANQDFLFKLIIIGDTGVGKSCLLARVMDNEFKVEHQVTIGVEFGSFVLKLEEKLVKLQIWDTAGQESFRSITRIFYRGAHCVFLTYDITREDTFNNVVDWMKEVKQHANADILIYLIGNRADLEDQREVPKDRAIEFAKANKIDKVFETSAKTGSNVEEVFALAGKEMYFQQKNQQDDSSPTPKPKPININNGKKGTKAKKNGGGCAC